MPYFKELVICGCSKSNYIFRTSQQAWIKDRYFTTDIPDNIDLSQRKDVHYVNIPNHLLPPNHNNTYNVKKLLLKNSSYIGTILNKRIALATQLSVEPPYSSEQFQVANYGVGGQYGMHLDSFGFKDVFASKERNAGKSFLHSLSSFFPLLLYSCLDKVA